MQTKHPDISFLAGGGEMGRLTREKDWSDTSLGLPPSWPQSLRTTLNIVLNSRFPMFLWWGPDLICFYNDAYRPSLGENGKHPFILGMKAAEAWTEIWDTIKPLIDQVLTTGEATWHEDQLISIYRNGKMEDVYWTFSYSAVNDHGNKAAGVLVTVVETTNKVNAYRSLEESNRRYLNDIIQAPVAMCFLRGKDHVVEVTNELMMEIWGKSAEQVMHRPIFEGVPESKGQGLEKLLEDVYNTGKKFVANERAVELSRNGRIETTYINFTYQALREPDGTVSGVVAIANDVTLQVIGRKKIEESEYRYSQMIHSSPFMISILKGPNMVIEIANDAILDSWGKGRNVIGKQLEEVMPEIAEQGFVKILQDVYTSGQPYQAYETPVYQSRHGKNDVGYFTFIYQPQRGLDGTIEGVAIIATEATPQAIFKQKIKESEKKYRELTQSLEEKVIERTAELNTNNAELARMNKELQSFAYISSHDLQEPLRKIKTFASRILEKEFNNLTQSGKDQFTRMKNAADRMQALIDDLLAYSQINISEKKFAYTNLNDIIEEVKADLKEELQHKNATLETTGMCYINIIRFQFRQLLHNLISNSLKFSSPDRAPFIQITSKVAEGATLENDKLSGKTKYCHLSVSDNGIGFDQLYSHKIFELFQRLHGRHEYDGTGIGLAIVKKIVDNHNGVINASGELNKGASFDIYIPTS